MSMTSDNTTFINFTIRTQPNKIVIDKNNLKWQEKKEAIACKDYIYTYKSFNHIMPIRLC